MGLMSNKIQSKKTVFDTNLAGGAKTGVTASKYNMAQRAFKKGEQFTIENSVNNENLMAPMYGGSVDGAAAQTVNVIEAYANSYNMRTLKRGADSRIVFYKRDATCGTIRVKILKLNIPSAKLDVALEVDTGISINEIMDVLDIGNNKYLILYGAPASTYYNTVSLVGVTDSAVNVLHTITISTIGSSAVKGAITPVTATKYAVFYGCGSNPYVRSLTLTGNTLSITGSEQAIKSISGYSAARYVHFAKSMASNPLKVLFVHSDTGWGSYASEMTFDATGEYSSISVSSVSLGGAMDAVAGNCDLSYLGVSGSGSPTEYFGWIQVNASGSNYARLMNEISHAAGQVSVGTALTVASGGGASSLCLARDFHEFRIVGVYSTTFYSHIADRGTMYNVPTYPSGSSSSPFPRTDAIFRIGDYLITMGYQSGTYYLSYAISRMQKKVMGESLEDKANDTSTPMSVLFY